MKGEYVHTHTHTLVPPLLSVFFTVVCLLLHDMHINEECVEPKLEHPLLRKGEEGKGRRDGGREGRRGEGREEGGREGGRREGGRKGRGKGERERREGKKRREKEGGEREDWKEGGTDGGRKGGRERSKGRGRMVEGILVTATTLGFTSCVVYVNRASRGMIATCSMDYMYIICAQTRGSLSCKIRQTV